MIKLSGFDLETLKTKYQNKQGINVFVNNIDLTHNPELNKITLSIRVANGLFEEDKKTKTVTEESKINVGFTINKEIELNEEWQQIFLNQKLSNNIFYSIKDSNIYNVDFTKLKADDFMLYSNIKDATYRVVSYTPTNFRNGVLKLQAKINDKTYDFDKKVGVGNYSNPFNEEFVQRNVNAYNFLIDTLTTADVSKVNESVYNIFSTNLLSGGYDTTRAIYTDKNDVPDSLHLGEDYLTAAFTPVVAPYDGEVIGIFYINYSEAEKNSAEGVGTSLMMRVKKSALNLTPAEYEKYFQIKDDNVGDDWMYIGFIHLDGQRTISQELGYTPKDVTVNKRNVVIAENLDPAHPKAVKKGDTIAFLGSPDTNGGWMPHVHITVYNNQSKHYNENNFFEMQKTRESRVNQYDATKADNTTKSPFNIRVDGVQSIFRGKGNPNQAYQVNPITGEAIETSKIDTSTNKTTKEKTPDGFITWIPLPISNYEKRNGLVDPNVLFKIRGQESFAFNLEALFELQEKQYN
ncbi:hypothetical protein HLA92_03280 [Mycoplasma miroungirhinis]|uniref:Uncharacterized protein n=1 Tax=Mycoplasma miroungirhinis TaxID=754516 RepID=A0A6M4JBP6_9MOLU|nr:hypothetical protein [Mycoplasma miroungirhinis]QJR44433.1 hypothetical protein HLA92_03280 [Mycoplasma miroungirhinis]